MRVLLALFAVKAAGSFPITTRVAGRQKVIINTDPGIDDSMAILLALASYELDVLGITINFGSLHNTTILAENALRVCELAGRPDIPVFVGSSEPLAMKFHNYGGPDFHGQDGLGNNNFPAPSGKINTSMHAVEFLRLTVHKYPKQVAIISLAPVTNIALAIRMDPKFTSHVKRIYMMGGTISEPGNVSPVAEANIANDAPAAKVVFDSKIPITMAGLDVTMHTQWTRDYMKELSTVNRVGFFINHIMQFYFDAYKKTGFPYSPCHDPSAVMALLDRTLYVEQHFHVDIGVAQTGDVWHGMTIGDRRGGPDSPIPPGFADFPAVLIAVNQTAFKKEFFDRISRMPRQEVTAIYT